MIASEKMRDRDENHRPKCCGGKGIPKAAAENSKLHENPTADERANDSQDDVRNAAEAPAPRNLSCEPSGDQPKESPREEAVCFKPDAVNFLCKHIRGKHEAS